MTGEDGKRWLVRKDGQDHGPFAALEILVLVRKGELGAEHELIDEKTGRAKPLVEWPGVQRALADRARVVAAEKAAKARASADRRTRILLTLRTAAVALSALGILALLAWLGFTSEQHLDLRVVGVLALSVLSLGAAVAYLERDGSQAAEAAFHSEPSATTLVVFGALSLAVSAPLVLLAPFLSLDPVGFGDELAHAEVAREIARSGISRGWVAGPLAGFPFGVHEPGLPAMLVRTLMAVGLAPLAATHLLGTLGSIATPLAAYVAAVRAHARPVYAFLGCAMLALTASNTPFAGGFEAFFGAGLLPTVLALPLCVLGAGELVRAEIRWVAPVLFVIAVLLSPPLAIPTLLFLAISFVVGGRSESVRETLRAALPMIAIAAAIYGPGLRALDVPFGPAPELAWRRVGFPLARLDAWLLGGELLDHDRTPTLTYLAIAALLALVLLAKRPSARAVLVACVLALGWPVLARVLFGEVATPVAAAIVAFLVPVHAIALAPLALAAALVVTLEEAGPRLEQIIDAWAPELDRFAGVLAILTVALAIGVAAPERWRFATETHDVTAARSALPCGPLTPEGYAHDEAAVLVRDLERGRLFYESDSLVAAQCAELDALVLESGVPLAASPLAGAHVGLAWLAFSRLEPMRDGSAARAEALGVRHVLDATTTAPPAPWSSGPTRAGLRMLSHAPATELVGVGCVTRTLQGDDTALREHLRDRLATAEGADELLSPSRLVLLEHTDGMLTSLDEPPDDCDASHATITETRREAGALEAEIESATPVDVVFRVAAFPSWGVLVDGTEVDATRIVSPGFLSVRVAAGRHRVVARANGLPWFWTGLGVATLVAVLLTFGRRSWFERKTMPLAEREDRWSPKKYR